MLMKHNVFPATITRYVSESGADTDGCGETAETPCLTMHPVLAQLLAQQPVVPPDLRSNITEVWNRAIDDVKFMLNRQKYPGPEFCKALKVFLNI